MPNFFENVGRANVLGTVNEAIQGLGRVQAMRIAEAASGRQAALDDQTLRRLRYEDQQRQKAEQQKQSYVPLSSAFPALKYFPDLKDTYLDTMRKGGYDVQESAGEVFATNEALQYLHDTFMRSDQLQQATLSHMRSGMENQLEGLRRQWQELADKPSLNPKEEQTMQVLQGRMESAKRALADFLARDRELQKYMAKKEADIETSRITEGIKSGYRREENYEKAGYDTERERVREEGRERRSKRSTEARIAAARIGASKPPTSSPAAKGYPTMEEYIRQRMADSPSTTRSEAMREYMRINSGKGKRSLSDVLPGSNVNPAMDKF